MKKRLFTLFCTLTVILSALPGVSALEGEAVRAADTLLTLGLLETRDETPSAPADRATATALLVRMSGVESPQSPGSPFLDVPEWASDSVGYAYQQGWVTGQSSGTFAAAQTINPRAWFTMLLRMIGYDDNTGEFTFSDAPQFARRIGLTSHTYGETLTRGDLYESVIDALPFTYHDGSSTVIARLVERGICNAAAANALGFFNPSLSARQIVDRHMSAVFTMVLYETQEEIQRGEPSADASGFFISADGLAVTNYHSIEGAIRAVATLVTGESYEVVRIIWFDVDMDLALIRVSRTSLTQNVTSAFAFLQMAGTSDTRPGDIVYALGNPLGLGLAVSEGIVSAIGREVERYTFPCVMNTASISQGSSGGALMNVYGHVIAVTSGAYSAGNNMYLAVPVDVIRSVDATEEGWTLQEIAEERAAQMEADREM